MLSLTDYTQSPLPMLAAIAVLINLALLVAMYVESLNASNLLRSIDRSLNTLPTVEAADAAAVSKLNSRKAGGTMDRNIPRLYESLRQVTISHILKALEPTGLLKVGIVFPITTTDDFAALYAGEPLTKQ